MATLPINLGINGNWILYQKTTSKIETKKSVLIQYISTESRRILLLI